MDASQMKNIVVLKNIPSNIVEEAIVVLKPNKKAKQFKYLEKNNSGEKNSKKDNSKEYIVKEAEMVISNYISNVESKKETNIKNIKSINEKYKRLKLITLMLTGIIVIYTIVSLIK